MLLRRIYVGQKYPNIYTLSISTGKNQRTKYVVHYTFQQYEYNYKVITGCDTILQEYYITDRRKCQNTSTNSKKDAHKLQKGKLESLAGGLEGKDTGRSVDDPRFHRAYLISN